MPVQPQGVPKYALCPQCGRAVPSSAGEQFCLNDGQRLVVACAQCGAAISSPHARYCGACGAKLLNSRPARRLKEKEDG